MVAKGDTDKPDRYFEATLDHRGALTEAHGNWLLGVEAQEHPAQETTTLITRPGVFQNKPHCVLNGPRPEDMVVDYFLGGVGAVNGSSTPGKIVVRLNRKNSRRVTPFVVTCY